MAKCYVKAYFDWIEQTAALSDAEKGRLFISILEYARSGLVPDDSGRESILFPAFKAAIDRDNEISAQNSANGAMGGRGNKATESEQKRNKANESETKPTKTKTKTKTQEKDEENEKERVREKPAPRFSPPSFDEVKAYCLERGNGIDPQKFIDFYASKGWMVGSSKMRDWKASVRTWEGRDKHANASRQPADVGSTGSGGNSVWGISYSG